MAIFLNYSERNMHEDTGTNNTPQKLRINYDCYQPKLHTLFSAASVGVNKKRENPKFEKRPAYRVTTWNFSYRVSTSLRPQLHNYKVFIYSKLTQKGRYQYSFENILPKFVKISNKISGWFQNFWRRKCVRREIFWNVKGRTEMGLTWPLGHSVTYRGSSYTQNVYKLFYRKLDVEY